MRDKRPIDELSIEEIERILHIKKREQRMQRFRNGGAPALEPESLPPVPALQPPPAAPPQDEMTIPGPALEALPDDGGVPRFEEDLAPVQARPRADETAYATPATARRGVFNYVLLAVEVLAFVGLGAVLLLAYQGLNTVNNNIARTDALSATSEAELRARQIEPTATPIISISQVVLPGGHVWDEAGQHRFNLDEVPAPYRGTFQQQLRLAEQEVREVPPGGPIRVVIPAIAVDASIRAGDDWISLQAGVGHHAGSGNPGEQGNMVLTGHNDIFGEVFRRLPDLEPGNEIRVQSTDGRWYTYVVRELQAVDPTEVWVLDQSLGLDTPLTTLITCYPYRVNTQRMIVFAELVET
ncbi:MAG: sortase [Anaerolineales bacterium]